MRRHLKTLLTVSTMAIGLGAASALYAHDSQGSAGSMMGRGMMGDGGMMGQMSSMMETCNQMMQAMGGEHGGQLPNEQWPERTPEQPNHPQPDEDAG